MKIQTFLLASHAVATAASLTLFLAAFQTSSSLLISTVTICTIGIIWAAAWWTTNQFEVALGTLEKVIADYDACQANPCGFREFDEAASRIAENVVKWEIVAAKTREQTRDFKAMMLMLNDRKTTGEASSSLLREILSGLGHRLYNHLDQVESSTTEIQQTGQAIADGAEVQSHAVIKATSHVERLATTIDSISTNASSAKDDIDRNLTSASSALELVQGLQEGIKRVRNESQSCEKKVRGLCDSSRQVSNIVTTISDISAKTDLLALNASIESIRAGEHGSGFAIVADEVRKLAEQASDATREITSIIESMQVVTQESLRNIQNEKAAVESATECVGKAEQLLEKICDASKRDAQRLRDIASSSNQQLQIAQDVVLVVEEISQIAKANRAGAENICWTIKSLSKTHTPLNSTIEKLKNCAAKSPDVADTANLRVGIAPLLMPGPTPLGPTPLLGTATGETA